MTEAIEQWANSGLPGTIMQFVSLLACVLHLIGDDEGAIVLAAWAERRGVLVLPENVVWGPYQASDLRVFRDGLPAADRDRAAGVASAFDDSGVAAYARERVTRLDADSS